MPKSFGNEHQFETGVLPLSGFEVLARQLTSDVKIVY